MKVGDVVAKLFGDYEFEGRVVSVFRKFDKDGGQEGPERIVVQNWQGILHIFNPKQLVITHEI